jgi:hypothetical protein
MFSQTIKFKGHSFNLDRKSSILFARGDKNRFLNIYITDHNEESVCLCISVDEARQIQSFLNREYPLPKPETKIVRSFVDVVRDEYDGDGLSHVEVNGEYVASFKNHDRAKRFADEEVQRIEADLLKKV